MADAIAGVIDLGSNSIRLALFQRQGAALVPVYDEKEVCQLGRGLEQSGRLNPDGRVAALRALLRFRLLAESYGLRNISVLATAAIRDASDGRAFAEQVRIETGLRLTFLTGGNEAQYALAGVKATISGASGIVGDLGGGSLELASVGLTQQQSCSLPLGMLRLLEASGGDRIAALEIINREFSAIDWLPAMQRKTFYAVGGAWRTLAKAHIRTTDYPLNIVHKYEVDAAKLADYAAQLSVLELDEIARLKGVSTKRRETLALAALLLERVIAFGRPSRVCFSAAGLREGYLYQAQDDDNDALLSYSEAIAGESLAAALPDWTARLWRQEAPAATRLRIAACHLSKVEAGEHPGYRAQQAYRHLLALPAGGISHQDRCWLALAVYARHTGESHKTHTSEALALLDDDQVQRAVALGCVLRLAYDLTGGQAALLKGTSLKLDEGELILTLNAKREGLLNDMVKRRLDAAAAAFGATAKISSGKA